MRPTKLYGSEYWADCKRIEQNMSIAEMRLLKWMSEVTKENRIKNEYVRSSVDVVSKTNKKRENRLKLFEHVMR